MLQIRNVVFFFIVVGFLLQVLGDLQLNRYIRFFAGIIFLLMIMSPIYELVTREDVMMKIDLLNLWQEYEEAKNYDRMMSEHSENYTSQAEMVLVRDMEQTLVSEGFKIVDYEMIWDEENCIEEIQLYIQPVDDIDTSSEMSSTTSQANIIKEILRERYNPDFLLEVYCSE